MKNKFKITTFLILSQILSWGQDIHFSQFYNSPLLLNPALTGTSENTMQVGLNYRSQGRSITVPYITQSGFIEYKIIPEFLKRDWAGIGTTIYQDKAGDGSLQTTHGALYASYHKGLDYSNNYFASFGASMGFGNKSVNYAGLLFDSQWDGYKFNSTISSREPYNTYTLSFWDFSAGTMFTYSPSNRFSSFAGVSLLHINNPKETFYIDSKNQTGRKIVLHGGIDIKMLFNIYIQPQFMFSQKKKANEFLIGSNLLYLKNDLRLYIGIWTRLQRDVILLAGAEIKKLSIFFSYDYNFSDMSVISQQKGGFELTLIYKFESQQKRKATPGKKTPFGVAIP